jgi:DNA-binding GntR family transcriptional regulator
MTLTEFKAEVRALEIERTGSDSAAIAPLSVSEQVAKALIDLIVAGEIRPGQRLLETEIATRFNVSRAPVRESLRMLYKDGFIDLTPRRGAQVHLPTPEDVTNLYEIRAELFALAARKAAAGMDAALLKLARQGVALLQKMVKDSGAVPADFLDARTGIASLVMIAADNPKLWEMITFLGTQAVIHARVYETVEGRRQYARNWDRTIEAIGARDADAAAAAARQMSIDSRDVLLAAMRGEGAALKPQPRRVGRAR